MDSIKKTVLLLLLAAVMLSGCANNPNGQIPLVGENCRQVEYTENVPIELQVPVEKEVCNEVPQCREVELEFESRIAFYNIDREETCLKSLRKCLKYSEGECTMWKDTCYEFSLDCEFTVTNNDSEDGSWRYTWEARCDSGHYCETTNNIYDELNQEYLMHLSPGETRTAKTKLFYTPKNKQECTARFIEKATKTVCRDSDEPVIECETVTELVTETVYEDRVKYREECS